MKHLIKEYIRELALGFITTLIIFVVLIWTNFIITDFGDRAEVGWILLNLFSFVSVWVFFTFLIIKLGVYKFYALAIFIALVLVIGRYKGIGKSPIVFPLVILCGIGVTMLVVPKFLKKHSLIAIFLYGLIVVNYILYFNMGPDAPEHYRLNFVNSLLVPIPIFIGLWGYEQWQNFKIIQADKAKAELALLKSQVNPHFFFNTLNNLYGLVVEQSTHAPDVILKLSDMMRYSIYEGKKDSVKLVDEVKYLESFIELHQLRHQKKVDIKFTHEVNNEIQVAPLLYINLLENAFKHGIESMTENAFVHLNLKTVENKILFKIENNYEPKPDSHKIGIGLENLKKRLIHLYPNRHELNVENNNGVFTVLLNVTVKS